MDLKHVHSNFSQPMNLFLDAVILAISKKKNLKTSRLNDYRQ